MYFFLLARSLGSIHAKWRGEIVQVYVSWIDPSTRLFAVSPIALLKPSRGALSIKKQPNSVPISSPFCACVFSLTRVIKRRQFARHGSSRQPEHHAKSRLSFVSHLQPGMMIPLPRITPGTRRCPPRPGPCPYADRSRKNQEPPKLNQTKFESIVFPLIFSLRKKTKGNSCIQLCLS